MVRTAADKVTGATGGKTLKKVSIKTSSFKKKKGFKISHGAGNRMVRRDTPGWQKKISTFLDRSPDAPKFSYQRTNQDIDIKGECSKGSDCEDEEELTNSEDYDSEKENDVINEETEDNQKENEKIQVNQVDSHSGIDINDDYILGNNIIAELPSETETVILNANEVVCDEYVDEDYEVICARADDSDTE